MLKGESVGDKPQDPERFQAIDLGLQDPDARYRLLTGAVVPRPIALVSTICTGGLVNLAPFSQFMILAANPGLLGFSASRLAAGPKHTIANLRTIGELVINIAHSGLARQVQTCAEELSREASEADHAGLALMASEIVRPPRVAEAPIQFECTLDDMIELGDVPNTIVVARIRLMHVREDILLPGSKIDTLRLDPLGRIGGRNYCRIGTIQSA